METIDPNTFWAKVKGVVRQAGEPIVMEVMKAWHVAHDPQTPHHAKAILFGALAYFVLPVDAIPDAVPIVGFSDDLAALGAALYATNAYITDHTLAMARASVTKMFG
jgi:uncharacterized membrane protein YkvA (DUF1232 family)